MFDNKIWMLLNGAMDTYQMCDLVELYDKQGNFPLPALAVDTIKELKAQLADYIQYKFGWNIAQLPQLAPEFDIKYLDSKEFKDVYNYMLEMLQGFVISLSQYEPKNVRYFTNYQTTLNVIKLL